MNDTEPAPLSSYEDRRQLREFQSGLHHRLTLLEKNLPAIVGNAMKNHAPPGLNEEELHWVKLAIKREAQSIDFRKAVIEKTFTGVIWALLGALGTGLWVLIKDYAALHGWKP